MFGLIKIKKLSIKVISMLVTLVIAATNAMPYVPLSAGSEGTPGARSAEELYDIMTRNAGEEPLEDGFAIQSIELFPDEEDGSQAVTLDGVMPESASATAVDVTGDYDIGTLAGMENGSGSAGASDTSVLDAAEDSSGAAVLAAYDITITGDSGEEFQPDEDKPIFVEIVNPDISAGSYIELWHITGDGVREQITDFTVGEGRISFYASGFSVYAIVVDENVQQQGEDGDYGWKKLNSLEDLADYEDGLYISYSGLDNNGYYFYKNVTVDDKSTIGGTNGRIGIQKLKPSRVEPDADAAKYYFEPVEGSDNQYYVYCYDNDNNKQYVCQYVKKVSNKDSGCLGLTTNTDERTPFTASCNSGKFQFNNGAWYWNMQGGVNGARFCSYNSANDGNNYVYLWYFVPYPDDPYQLDGKRYGLMNYDGGSAGNALMVGDPDHLQLVDLTVRAEEENGTPRDVYVCQDADISIWTFNNAGSDNYILTTDVEDDMYYLKVDADGTVSSTTDPTQATAVKFAPGSDGSFELIADGKVIVFDGSRFSAKASPGSGDTRRFNFVRSSGISETDEFTYTANKVSVSQVPNGQKVLVYTRIWNNDDKTYEFYLVDHDGSLVRCYERGDSIMWVDDRANTLLWDFTEYYWEGTTDPSYYYELYNSYSEKYLAPQQTGGQILADEKIGINMPGRKDNEYYSSILAWDNNYYAYTGIKADVSQGKIVSCPRRDAEDFYFATVESITPHLTEVDTVDNNDYGITLKMIDYKSFSGNVGGVTYGEGNNKYQSDVLGDTSSAHGTAAKTGILTTDLKSNGYPDATVGGQSLSKLFDDASADITNGSIRTVNHLFIKSIYEASGYFEFDSLQNFATLANDSDNDFTVYKELGTTEKTSFTAKHGQFLPYNTITAGNYSQTNPENRYSALSTPGNAAQGLLPDSDPRKYEKLHALNETVNYHNGTEMSASFVQTPSGQDAWGHDIIFEFTGDDDFWLYVDDELVLDLGGVHSALAGSVNFHTGIVKSVDDRGNPTTQTLRQIFDSNYRTRYKAEHPDADDATVNAAVDEYLAQYFEPGQPTFKEYSYHHMKIFYMERGAGASNLHLRFNLSYIRPGHVMLKKNVTGGDSLDLDYMKYPYLIYYKKDGSDTEHQLANDYDLIRVTYQNSTQEVEYVENYTPPGSSADTVYKSVYLIRPNENVEISFPDDAISYRIVECGISGYIYDEVKINGTVIEGTLIEGNTYRRNYYESSWASVEERPTILFDNKIDEDALKKITFTKELYSISEDGSGELSRPDYVDTTTFSFRLYLSNGADICYEDENGHVLNLTDMYRYRVKDRAGNYCTWDPVNHCFVSTGEDDFSALSEDEQEAATFETSINGSISMIPAWYTVEIPDIPIGTLFEIEERQNEIPIGYDFSKYECVYEGVDDPSYAFDPGHENRGEVLGRNIPYMKIINHKGWGLSANKVWTDENVMQSYDPIYVAVYYDDGDGNAANDELIENTVKRIAYPETEARYYFDKLHGRNFNNLYIREVKLTNPGAPNAEGLVTSYDSITPVSDGSKVMVNGVSKGNGRESENGYAVSYKKGALQGSALNAREDTITNTRSGGVVITLYKMGTRTPIANGVFTLTQKKTAEEETPGNDTTDPDDDTTDDTPGDDTTDPDDDTTDETPEDDSIYLGTYTSDETGKVTVTYCLPGVEYTLTETKSPAGYIGLPTSVTFTVDADGTVANIVDGEPVTPSEIIDNSTRSTTYYWEQGYKDTNEGDDIIARIDVFNKQFIFEVYKYNSETSKPIANAKFNLYKAISGIAGEIQSDKPESEEPYTSDRQGIVAGIDSTLKSGTYYLVEEQLPNYSALEGDIKFTIDSNGTVTLSSNAYDSAGHRVTMDSSDTNGERKYIINVPNRRIVNEAKLTVTKTVRGAFGDKTAEFDFTLTTDEGDDTISYNWTKNGVEMTPLSNGGTFKLRHGDTAEFTIPADLEVTVAESSEGYVTTFELEGEDPENASSLTFTLSDDSELEVTNAKEGVIPTGVNTHLTVSVLAFIAIVSCIAFVLVRQKKYAKADR